MEILEKVEQLKAELDSLRPLDAEVEARIWQKFRLDWNYHSNKLEGNTYSYGETKMLLMKELTAGGKPKRDAEEITGHDQAITFIIDSIKNDEPLTEAFIRHLHKLTLVRPFWAEAKTADGQPTKRLIKVGKYKTEPNHVETQSGEIFYFAEPIETPAKMQELVEWFGDKTKQPETNAVLVAAEFHYGFVRIHPFDDGNGRLARLLMNFVLMKYGYPPVIIKNEDKDNYIAVLEQADFAILKPFVEYVGQNLTKSLELMIRGAKGEEIDEREDLDKELALLQRKFEGMGEKIDLTSHELELSNLYHTWFLPLVTQFLEAGDKFQRFYLRSNADISLDGHLIFRGNAESFSASEGFLERFKISSSASVIYFFHTMSQAELADISFRNQIFLDIFLDEYRLHAISEGKTVFELNGSYDEAVTDSDIAKITSLLAKSHKEFIENRLSDLNNVN